MNVSATRGAWCAAVCLCVSLVAGQAAAAPPEVVTVPWRGTLDLPHEVYNGKAIHLKGVARGIAAGATAFWNPGDGSANKPVAPNPVSGFDFDLGVIHTYPNVADGTPFTATLTVCNGAECASDTYRVVVRPRTLDVEINIAIDQGLWYLHRAQVRSTFNNDGQWVYSDAEANTASAVQAFQINNHFQTNGANDPYADTVARGLKYMFSGLRTIAIGPQPAGNPDTNGNGLGADTAGGSPYVLGQVMDAIATTRTPTAVTTTGPNGAALPAGIAGRTYFDIVQDMVDTYAWGQYDAPNAGRGGWRYGWNQFPDGSASQWGAIGILAARDLFGAMVPAFVYSENLQWVAYSQYPSPPLNATDYGYTGPIAGPCNAARNPSGLVQLVLDGVPKTDVARWKGVENTIASIWTNGSAECGYQDSTNYYALFALAKAMRLALPSQIVVVNEGQSNAIDWFKADCVNPDACNPATDKWGVARTLIRDQDANGAMSVGYWSAGDLSHAWAVIILTGTLRLEPVAHAAANPNPGAAGVPVNFDGSGSFHQDSARTIVTYEWDWDNNGTFDASGVTATHAFACATLPTPCNYPVTLRVTDDGTPTPLIDTDTIVVTISNPPHPPTADANGPYWVCVNEQLTLNGAGSFDVDQGTSLPGNPPDAITAYGWEKDFLQPLDFDELGGVSPVTTYGSPGTFDLGLLVTDNSAAAFGGPNLTDQDFTTVRVTDCSCMGAVTIRSKPAQNQLVWAPVSGAVAYDIYRSTSGPGTGYSLRAAGVVTSYATYLDTNLTNGTTYWYRVVPKGATGNELCGSLASQGTPQAGRR
jgi:hypothetical protein